MALYDPTVADEKRDERLTELTREAADSMTQALAAGLPKTVQLIDEALGEYLQDDQARAELLRKTAAGGSPLTKILSDLIWIEAGVRAEQQLQRMEKEGAEAALEARAEQVAEAWLCPLH
jgi:hypothetical protein